MALDEATDPLATNFAARTPIAELVGLTDAHLQDPSKILSEVTAGQDIVSTKVFLITTAVNTPTAKQSPNPGVPNAGGGADNIAFLVGDGTGPNADIPQMTATFWVEEIRGQDGKTFMQLQYIQRVLLAFDGKIWPHISLATLVVTSEA